MTEEIKNKLDEIKSLVDFKEGDWVECCNLLPGICTKISIGYSEEHKYIYDNVEIFYPHMSLINNPNNYIGGSCCSIRHCRPHKISYDYATKLFTLGRQRLDILLNKFKTSSGMDTWEELVEKEYNKFIDQVKCTY